MTVALVAVPYFDESWLALRWSIASDPCSWTERPSKAGVGRCGVERN